MLHTGLRLANEVLPHRLTARLALKAQRQQAHGRVGRGYIGNLDQGNRIKDHLIALVQ